MSWSEDRLHRWLASLARPRGLRGSRGHDAAVLEDLGGRAVVCVDQCVEGVHFTSDARAAAVGAKAAGRALSDLAATAARPRAVVLAIDAPRDCDEAWLKRAIQGVRAMARVCGADLVGGDLCASAGPVRLCVTAIGAYSGASKPPGRDRARVGQRVVVTGRLGGSLLGRHLKIVPRVDEGLWLHARGATAMMDVSDGLAWDLYRLALASGVAIELDTERVPLSRDAHRLAKMQSRSALDCALHDGEDHELVATISANRIDALVRESKQRCPELAVIGRVVRGSGLRLIDSTHGATTWTPSRGGYRHGD